MSDLRDLERRTFRAARDDGLLDVMIAAIVSILALAPLLKGPLGDFWSSAIFGPVWFGLYLITQVVSERVVVPRIGTVEAGADRRSQLRRVNTVLLVVYGAALGLGVTVGSGVWAGWLDLRGFALPIPLGVVALVVLSLVAYANSVWRYAVYGLLLAIAPLVGEWLWQNDLANHHGFPVAFGAAALIILVTGIVRLTTVLRNHPLFHYPATG